MFWGTVSRTEEGPFRYQGWPTAACDRNGTVYVAASGHRVSHICPFGKTLLYKSTDGGISFSKPEIVNDTALDDRDAGILIRRNGDMIISWFNHSRNFYFDMESELKEKWIKPEFHALTDGMFAFWRSLSEKEADFGSFIRISRDSGNTFSEKIKVPVSAPHGPIEANDGSLIYLGKANYIDGSLSRRICCAKSTDGGLTWEISGVVPVPDGYGIEDFHEPHAVMLPSGRILGAIRMERRSPKWEFRIFLTFSDDFGTTWSKPEMLDLWGSPPHLMLHSSGAVILTYGKRTAPLGAAAKVSFDSGKTWGREIALNASGTDPDLGYASTCELPDGSLFSAYYQKLPGDDFNSILYTKWSLTEL